MTSADGYEPRIEPLSTQALASSPTQRESQDDDLAAAIAQVVSNHALCVALSHECERNSANSPSKRRCHQDLRRADIERRKSLQELSVTPATDAKGCSAKLKVLMEMFSTYGWEDAEMVERLVDFAQEATSLIRRFESEKL